MGLDLDDLLGNRQGLLRDLAGVDGDVDASHLFGLSLFNSIDVLEESISFQDLIVFSLEAQALVIFSLIGSLGDFDGKIAPLVSCSGTVIVQFVGNIIVVEDVEADGILGTILDTDHLGGDLVKSNRVVGFKSGKSRLFICHIDLVAITDLAHNDEVEYFQVIFKGNDSVLFSDLNCTILLTNLLHLGLLLRSSLHAI